MTSAHMLPRIAGLGLLVLLSACTEADPIRQYQVARKTDEPATPASQAGVAWFFKLVGPNETVTGLIQPFGELVRSVKFGTDGVPAWVLPDGWKERRDQGIRFATLTPPGESSLETTVIPLPHTAPSSMEYLRDNLNRWRGELGLPAREGDDWFEAAKSAGEVSQVESNGKTVTIVNLAGTNSKFGDARMLAALLPVLSASGETPQRPPVAPPAASAPESLPFTFTLPDGWRQGPSSPFEMAVFFVGEGDKALKISVSTAGGDLAGNINRWRGQVQLPSVPAEEIEASATAVTVGGAAGKSFTLEGPADTILGAIVEREVATWFFKARGPKESADPQKDNFAAFLKSIAFKS